MGQIAETGPDWRPCQIMETSDIEGLLLPSSCLWQRGGCIH